MADADESSDDGPAVRREFVRLVVVFNVALLALWLGVLFAVFEARYRDAAGLLIVGTAAFAYGYRGYRRTTSVID